MGIKSRTSTLFFLLLVSAVRIRSSENNQTEPCPNIGPPQNFSLDKALGDWYFYRAVTLIEYSMNTSTCKDILYSLLNERVVFAQSAIRQDMFTINTQEPWRWTSPGLETRTLYVADDASKMVQVHCHPGKLAKGYALFSKQTPLSEDDITAIERIVDDAGGIRSSEDEELYVWQSMATCPEDQ